MGRGHGSHTVGHTAVQLLQSHCQGKGAEQQGAWGCGVVLGCSSDAWGPHWEAGSGAKRQEGTGGEATWVSRTSALQAEECGQRPQSGVSHGAFSDSAGAEGAGAEVEEGQGGCLGVRRWAGAAHKK